MAFFTEDFKNEADFTTCSKSVFTRYHHKNIYKRFFLSVCDFMADASYF